MIDLQDVRFRWRPQDAPVLDIPSFTVAAGERVFLAGPSGSGKTTLLNLLGGVAQAEAGRVEVDGTDLSTLSGAARDALRAERIGFIFQMFNLIPYLSVLDNVTLPCRFSRARSEAARAAAGSVEAEAERLLRHMEIGQQALLHRPAAALSTGQQQRVAVARSLIGRPRLVIADEPTSALDRDVRRAFMELLFREIETAGATLLFVSHDETLAAQFGRTVKLAEINRAEFDHTGGAGETGA